MSAGGREVRLARSVFNRKRHVCAFFRNKAEEFRTRLPFIVDDLAAGKKAIHVVDSDNHDSEARSRTP
jgi:hypothetical protein